MKSCANCESHVSEDFYRVFEIDGYVLRCPNCAGLYGVARETERAYYGANPGLGSGGDL